MKKNIFLNELGIICPLGAGKQAVADQLFLGHQNGFELRDGLLLEQSVMVGQVSAALPDIGEQYEPHVSRNNQLLLAALMEIEASVRAAIDSYGGHRVGVVLGSSTSGISDGEAGFAERINNGKFPPGYHFEHQDTASISSFAAAYLGVTGPAMTISTACTSSAKTLGTARRLINAGICDAVVVGGSDTICRMTLNGFNSLNSVSPGICNPFSRHRDGITIGEGAAVFLLSANPAEVKLMGVGETSDAHHVSAPDPTGTGAINAMRAALQDAGVESDEVDYLNLHGTATPLNDAMEALAVSQVFERPIACSSTKGMTGHMLGATGGVELGFLWLALQAQYGQGRLPPHVWDGQFDEQLPVLNFCQTDHQATNQSSEQPGLMMSNSFAFGGNNISVLLGGLQ